MNRKIAVSLAFATAGLIAAYAQAPPASAAATLKGAYTRIKTNYVKAAEKMPEEFYSYKPVDALETFGQRVAHIADPQLSTCTGILGDRKTGTAKTKTAKADLVAALKESFDACDKAVDALTDANAMEPGCGRPRAGAAHRRALRACGACQ